MLISAEGCKWERYATSINQTIPFSTTVHLEVGTKEWEIGVEAEKWGVRDRIKRRREPGFFIRTLLNWISQNTSAISRDIIKLVAHKLFYSVILLEQESLLGDICGSVHDYFFMGKASRKLWSIVMSIWDRYLAFRLSEVKAVVSQVRYYYSVYVGMRLLGKMKQNARLSPR